MIDIFICIHFILSHIVKCTFKFNVYKIKSSVPLFSSTTWSFPVFPWVGEGPNSPPPLCIWQEQYIFIYLSKQDKVILRCVTYNYELFTRTSWHYTLFSLYVCYYTLDFFYPICCVYHYLILIYFILCCMYYFYFPRYGGEIRKINK